MDRPPYNTASDQHKSPDSKRVGGLLSFLKHLGQRLRAGQRASATAHLKKEINHLEKERAKERAALLKQRRFYEKLIRRKTTPPVSSSAPKPMPSVELPVAANVEPIKEMPVIETRIEEQPKPVTPAPIIEEESPIVSAPEREQITKETIQTETVPTTADITPPEQIKKPSAVTGFFAKLRSAFSHGTLAGKLAAEREAEEAVKHKSEVEERAWQPYNGVKANLIKDQGVLFFNWQQRLLILALALVLCCLAISLVYVGLLIWQKERLNDNQSTLANFEAINAEIAKNEKDIQEIIEFNRKLDVVNYILANHVYWTNFLGFLENNTLKDVYYESFTGDIEGQYTIPSVARNLDAVSLQLEVMKAYNLVRSVQYSGGQTVPAGPERPETVKFNLEVIVDPKLFIK